MEGKAAGVEGAPSPSEGREGARFFFCFGPSFDLTCSCRVWSNSIVLLLPLSTKILLQDVLES
jgi:hypothetical protein